MLRETCNFAVNSSNAGNINEFSWWNSIISAVLISQKVPLKPFQSGLKEFTENSPKALEKSPWIALQDWQKHFQKDIWIWTETKNLSVQAKKFPFSFFLKRFMCIRCWMNVNLIQNSTLKHVQNRWKELLKPVWKKILKRVWTKLQDFSSLKSLLFQILKSFTQSMSLKAIGSF